MAALGGTFQQQHLQQQHSLLPPYMHQQQRHRWAGTADFNGSEQAVSAGADPRMDGLGGGLNAMPHNSAF